MLSYLTEQLTAFLSRHGVVVDVTLRSEHSLVEEEERQEVEIRFAEREEEGLPVAAVHLVMLPQESGCEVEAEIAFAAETVNADAAERLWKQAREIVPDISLTEKKRYREPGKCVEANLLLDFHFEVEREAAGSVALEESLQRFSANLGKLVRL
jgi:hypothetical protein